MYPGYNRSPPKRTVSQHAGSDHYYFSLNSSNQEFTLDLTQTNAGGTIPLASLAGPGRSPGKSSPGRSANVAGGRCVREVEQQLDELRKENFNLKLKIYLMEDRFGRLYGTGEKADLAKHNIELQVEVQSLKKEVSDKVELLKQATVAIERLEKQQLSLKMQREKMDTALEALKEELSKHRAHVCPTIPPSNPLTGSSPMDNSVALYLEAFGTRALDSQLTPDSSRAENLERELEDLRKAFSDQLEELNSYRSQVSAAQHDLAAKSDAVQVLQNELADKEAELEQLSLKLSDTRKHLEALSGQLTAQNQKYEGLSVDFGNKQERIADLESDLAGKEIRIKQLVSEVDSWREILKRKDNEVKALEEELSKKEPEIEYKVQEIEQKDRIIEEKEGQIEQQNKIFLEIQITLDEKQKQIEELENTLKEKAKLNDELENNLKKAGRTLQGFVSEIQTKEKELESLACDTKKKEKRIRDLTSELKQVKEMFNKATWEAQCGRDDNVNTMAEEENERLWAELEEKNRQIAQLDRDKESLRHDSESVKSLAVQLGQKEEALANADRQLRALNQSAEEVQRELELKNRQLIELQKENWSLKQDRRSSSRSSSSSRKLSSVENIRHPDYDDLKKQLADTVQHLNIVQAEKNELMNEQAELRSKLNDSNRKSTSGEVKDLQRQIKVKDVELDRVQRDLTKVKEENRKLREKEIELENVKKELQKSKAMLSPKDQTPVKRRLEERERELERLRNEMARLRNEKENADTEKCAVEIKYRSVREELERDCERLQVSLRERELEVSEMRTKVADVENELERKRREQKLVIEAEVMNKEREIESLHQRLILLEKENSEIASLKADLKLRLEERRVAQETLERTKQLLSQSERNMESATTEGLLSKEMQDRLIREKNDRLLTLESTERALRNQIDSLKIECDMYRSKNSNDMVQSLLDETKRQQDMVKKYKEEVVKLRKRLADSTNACDMLRTRLEEMADFLEEILNLDERGLVDLSAWSFQHKQMLHNSIAKSRELSHTLSQSLIVGMEEQDNELSVLDGFVSSTSVSSWSMTRADESRRQETRVGQSELFSLDNSEVVNWSHSLITRTAGRVIDSEPPTSRLCIVDRSLHNSQPIQSADYDVIANAEEHRRVAARLTDELEATTAELTTARMCLAEFERKLKDQTLIIENLKHTILKLEELSSKKESDQQSRQANGRGSTTCVTSEATTQTSTSEDRRASGKGTGNHDFGEATGDGGAYQEFGSTSKAVTETHSVTRSSHEISNLATASASSHQVLVATVETRINHSGRCFPERSFSAPNQNEVATPYEPLRQREMKFVSSTPFHHQGDIFRGLERPNFSLSATLLKVSPVAKSPRNKAASESDTWSEPDRDVSQQRIGLDLADSDQPHQKRVDSVSESDGQLPTSTKPSPRKLRENARKVKSLKQYCQLLESSAKTLKEELFVYQFVCNQLQKLVPSTEEGRDGPVKEVLALIFELAEKRKADCPEQNEEISKARGGVTQQSKASAEADIDLQSSRPRLSAPDQKSTANELKQLLHLLQSKIANHSPAEESKLRTESSVSKFGTLGKLEAKLKKANSTIKDLQEKSLLMKESLMRKEARSAEKDGEISRLGHVLKEKEYNIKELQSRIDEVEREKGEAQKMVESLKRNKENEGRFEVQLNNVRSENRVLEREVETMQTKLSEKAEVVEALEREVKGLEAKLEQCEAGEVILSKFRDLEKAFEALSADKARIENQLSEKLSEISLKNATIDNLMADMTAKSQELEHIQNQLHKAEQCINNFESARQNYIEHISGSERASSQNSRVSSSSSLPRPGRFLFGKREDGCDIPFEDGARASGVYESTQRSVPSNVSRTVVSEYSREASSTSGRVQRQYSQMSEVSQTTCDEISDVTSLSFKGFLPPPPIGLTSESLVSPTEVKSPDLGIESDPASRFSSLGNHPEPHEDTRGPESSKNLPGTCRNCAVLYSKYQRAKKALATTADQLRASNERKEKIDKALNKELVKTHGVLKQAKGYLELCHSTSAKK